MDDIIRVLVVDDSKTSADEVRNQLTGAGDFDAYSAYSPAEAKTWLGSNEINFVVMDINLPGQNGISLAKHIRNVMEITVPVLFISAKLEDDSRAAIRRIGPAVGFLQKPFAREDLLEAVTALLHKNELFLQMASMGSLLKQVHKELKAAPKPVSPEEIVQRMEADVCSKAQDNIAARVKEGLLGDAARVAAGVSIKKFEGLIDKAMREAEGDSSPGRILAKIEAKISHSVPSLLRAAAPKMVDERITAGYVWGKLCEGYITKVLLAAFFVTILGFVRYMWKDIQAATGMAHTTSKTVEGVKATQDKAVLPSIRRLDRLPDQVSAQRVQMQEQSVHIQYQSERLANVDKTLQILAEALKKPRSTNPRRWGIGIKVPTKVSLPARLPKLGRWKRHGAPMRGVTRTMPDAGKGWWGSLDGIRREMAKRYPDMVGTRAIRTARGKIDSIRVTTQTTPGGFTILVPKRTGGP